MQKWQFSWTVIATFRSFLIEPKKLETFSFFVHQSKKELSKAGAWSEMMNQREEFRKAANAGKSWVIPSPEIRIVQKTCHIPQKSISHLQSLVIFHRLGQVRCRSQWITKLLNFRPFLQITFLKECVLLVGKKYFV